MPREIKGILLDAAYSSGKNGESDIELFVKTPEGIRRFEDKKFRPYFYAITKDTEKAIEDLREKTFAEGAKALKAETVKKSNAENVVKIYFKSTNELIIARQEISAFPWLIEKREYDLPFAKRYLIDKRLEPMNGIRLVVEGNEILEAEKFDSEAEFSIASFDFETLSAERFSTPDKDPVLMASFAGNGHSFVLTYKEKFAGMQGTKTFGSEKEMLEALVAEIRKAKLDILVTYNGDSFDLPYLAGRAEKLGFDDGIASDGSKPKIRRRGQDNAVKINGLQHLDAFQMLRVLNRFAVVSLIKFDLESVAESLFGTPKEKIKAADIARIWEKGSEAEFKRLVAYNREDAEATLRIAETFLPLETEFCRLVKQTLFDVSRASASNLVEALLYNKCFETNSLVPEKPSDEEVGQRIMQSFEGGFVREPKPGLHERIAVLDFSSLHPSIMVSHNISPDSLDCRHEECKAKNSAPTNHWFCTKKDGFLSSIIKDLFERRMALKKKLKAMDRKSKEFALLNARTQALKILLNSFYGYLGYARSRWYDRECARAVTMFSQKYVQEVAKMAEEEGFEVIYGDTDSNFLKIPAGKNEKDVEEFVRKTNDWLPGIMQIDLQGFYKRGIFVSRKGEEKAAKKRYALMDYKDNLKIVGFEYVRRDWSNIAKETQRQVIEAVLKEGRPEKAIAIVKKVLAELKEGKVPKKELVILTQIKRPLKKYVSKGPHVVAAEKAIKRGKDIGVGSVIGYIVTRTGKSISDKAELEEFVNEGDYDADYYISHQVLPAVEKIVQELGYSEQDLLHGGKQSSLNRFF
ncbi:MAG: ribonuclease H-like domain-containing protein [Candidatus Diapherotrites archaeon]|nr:ribonuclease H-like domain-containing protein [Candidatus Diapherotrites archaeon]